MGQDLHAKRMRRAAQSLEGLSCGDAFGERFFLPDALAQSLIQERAVPAPPWFFTDDTVMALSILETLAEHREINADALAISFAGRYDAGRGYGPAMHKLLPAIRRQPQSWRTEAAALFRISEQASLSSIPTHSHADAVAGAVAVAVAAGLAWQMKNSGEPPNRQDFLQRVHQQLPDSYVRKGIRNAIELPPEASVETAVAKLGNGSAVTAPDTVPFALWCAARHLGSYEAALWATVSGRGDRDTTCAIVGGIVVMYAGAESIPVEWLEHREQIPSWVSSF
jgi:ADP-ribosylglycohydrolase